MTEFFYYGLYLDVNGAVLTPKLMYRVARFEVYGGIGAGYYWVDNEIDVHTPTGVTESHIKDTVWGYHGLAGASYDLTRTWYLGLEGKYVNLLDFKDTTDFTGRSVSLGIGLRF
jgi:opacity protein-like surface antigen